MYDEAKNILVNALSDTTYASCRDEVRFELGVALFAEGKLDLAATQWNKLLRDHPGSSYAQQVRSLLDVVGDRMSTAYAKYGYDLVFDGTLDLAQQMWTFRRPDYKIRWDELRDPVRALAFYEALLLKFPEPQKKALVHYCQFLLVAGFNDDGFGYQHRGKSSSAHKTYYEAITGKKWEGEIVSVGQGTTGRAVSNGPSSAEIETAFRAECDRLLKAMSDDMAPEYMLADANFLMGVVTSGSTFWGNRVRVSETSRPYFEEVMRLTINSPVNTRRVFAALWLANDERVGAPARASSRSADPEK
jgi:tetratricopeptide (TPR) repeat protein